MHKILRENGLSLAAFALFVASLVGHAVAGLGVFNDEAWRHASPALGLLAYLGTGHFWGSVFENWQSEFLQMGLFVLLTVRLKQKGSSESKKLEGDNEVDEDPRDRSSDPEAPWPVRKGGFVLRVYEHSLSLALGALFFASWAMHAVSGWRSQVQLDALRGEPASSFVDYVASSDFWFDTFQNWQSEFLSFFVLVVFSIFLRERGSAQSKRVAAPHAETGE